MKKISQYTIALIIFSVAAMSNKTCSMDDATETFSLSYCKDNDKKKVHKLLKEFSKDNPDFLIHSRQNNIIDCLCWYCYSPKTKIQKTLEIAKKLTMHTTRTLIARDIQQNVIGIAGINYHENNSKKTSQLAEVKCFICTESSDNENKIFSQILKELFADQKTDAIASLHYNRRRGLNDKEIAGCLFARNNFSITYVVDLRTFFATFRFPCKKLWYVLTRQEYLEQSANS